MSVSGGESANGKSRKKVVKSRPFVFINHDLSAEQRGELAALDLVVEFPYDLMGELVAEGFSIKLAPDKKRGGFRAHMSIDTYGDGSVEHCLVGWGSSVHNAWASLMYRHMHLAAEDWGALIGDGAESTEFG